MGTKQITARVDEELLQDVASRIEAIKRESRGGVEINLATVIRYSLEKYLEEQEEIDKDIKIVKFNLKAITDKEKLEKLLKASEEIGELFKAGYEGEFETGIDCFYLSEAIRYRLFELNQKRDK
jgi:hypothetical protein